MGKELSCRSFPGKAVAAMCTVVVFEFSTVAGAKQLAKLKTVSSQVLEKENMPHVIVKLWSGPSEQDKARLAEAIVGDVVENVGVGEGSVWSVSVAIEEVPAADWKSKVYDPDIKQNMDKLYKKPGYSM